MIQMTNLLLLERMGVNIYLVNTKDLAPGKIVLS